MAPAPVRKSGPSPVLVGTGVLVLAAVFLGPRIQWDSVPSTIESMPKPEVQVDSGTPNLSSSAIRVGIAFVVVCGLCVGVAKVLKPRAEAANANMVVEARLALDHRSTLCLVRAGNRRLVMGVDATGVRSLVELPPVPEAEPESVKVASPQLLADVLNRLREDRAAA